MAIAKIFPTYYSALNTEKTFTPSTNIKINSVENKYLLPLNFKEGDIIESGTELKFNIGAYESSVAFPEAIIDYTEL
jgi:hypothetical protein|tara:strand:+ start:2255 stop:2485 length:231 start_codon:yes stop_codon:yes gene_type:complete